MLVQFNYDSKAKEVQHTYDSFLTVIDKSIPDIWLEESEDAGFKPVILPFFSNKSTNLAQNIIRQCQKYGKIYSVYTCTVSILWHVIRVLHRHLHAVAQWIAFQIYIYCNRYETDLPLLPMRRFVMAKKCQRKTNQLLALLYRRNFEKKNYSK